MTKRMAGTLTLLGVIAMGSAKMLSSQDQDSDAARQAAAQRQRDNEAIKQDQARQDFLKRSEAQSAANLDKSVNAAAQQRKKENEVKFDALQQSSRELMNLSAKTYNQIQSSGGQSVSVSLFQDLDKMEKLIKDMRKNAK